MSLANTLVDGDTNGAFDVFVHDLQTGVTSRVSVSSAGVQANGDNGMPAISPDCRYVAFDSGADNLVDGDTNGAPGMFVHDLQTGETSRVNVSGGTPAISSGGRYVAFVSSADNLVVGDTNGKADVFVYDRLTGETSRVSISSAGAQGNNISYRPSIHTDGRYVAFDSHANSLVDGDTNGVQDVFVHDRQTGVTSRVSVSSAGVQGNNGSSSSSAAISSDGRYVAFESWADNLVDGDTNGAWDVFVHDLQTGVTSRVSVSSEGVQGNGGSSMSSFSFYGRYVTFHSEADNLVVGDTNDERDIFVHDRQTGVTSRVSVSSAGVQSNDDSYVPAISSDGRYIAFESEADNLVVGDTNDERDIFVHDRLSSKLCTGDFDVDTDVDGEDLLIQLNEDTEESLDKFAENFGRNDCPN
jgi:Tol biopolymer transport system component